MSSPEIEVTWENVGVYDVIFTSNSSRSWMLVDPSQKQKRPEMVSSSQFEPENRHYLKPGRYMVQASYNGPEKAQLKFGSDNRDNYVIEEIPAGSHVRSTQLHTVVSSGGEYLYCYCPSARGGDTMVMTVFSTPEYQPPA